MGKFAMLPSHSRVSAQRKRLLVFEPPIAVEGYSLLLAWHQRRDGDPAIQHVAQVLRQMMGFF